MTKILKDKTSQKNKKAKKGNINNNKLYLQLNSSNFFDFFILKWFIFPINTLKGIKLKKDLLSIFSNYIPLVNKKVLYKDLNDRNEIFLEIDTEWFDFSKCTDDTIFLYSWIIPLSKVRNVFIQNNDILWEINHSLTFDDIFFPKNRISQQNLWLKEIEIDEENYVNKNENIDIIINEYIKQQRKLWGTQILLLEDKKYINYCFNKKDEDLDLLKEYNNKNLDNFNIKILVDILNENLNNLYKSYEWDDGNYFWSKKLIEDLEEKVIEIWKKFKEEGKEEQRNEMLEIYNKINNYRTNNTPKIYSIIQDLDKDSYYWILIILLIYQYHKINDINDIIENSTDNLKIKILLYFIFWEVIWYQKMSKNFKEINFRLSIEDPFNTDLYEGNKLKDLEEIQTKEVDKIIYTKKFAYPWSEKVLEKESLDLDKNNIDWYIQLEKDLKIKTQNNEHLEQEIKNIDWNLKREKELNNELKDALQNEKEQNKKLYDEINNIKEQLENKTTKINQFKKDKHEYMNLIDEIKKQDEKFIKNRKYIIESLENKTKNNEPNIWTDWNYTLPI